MATPFSFAFDKATTEGKITIGLLVIVSLFSWTVMITKARQLYRAVKAGKKFFAAYRATRDPLEMFNRKDGDFTGAPAYDVYVAGAEELAYHLKNNPVVVQVRQRSLPSRGAPMRHGAHTDILAAFDH